jgi:hypothetical protein
VLEIQHPLAQTPSLHTLLAPQPTPFALLVKAVALVAGWQL